MARLLLPRPIVKGVCTQMAVRNADRNYPAFVLALEEALGALDEGDTDEAALRRSFENSANAFGAEKALLLMVDGRAPVRLRAVASRRLSVEDVAACERGCSVSGVSSSRIRDAVHRGAPVMVQESGLLAGDAVAAAFRGEPVSVLCAPVCEPRSGRVIAVLYLQNRGARCAFGEVDLAWAVVYSLALGRVFGAARGQAAHLAP